MYGNAVEFQDTRLCSSSRIFIPFQTTSNAQANSSPESHVRSNDDAMLQVRPQSVLEVTANIA